MIKLTTLSLKERADNRPEIIKTLVGFSEKARREGLLVLEEDAKQVDDPFLGKGVRLVVDGTDPELVKDILETELDAMEERHHKNQDMFKQGGAFAPTVGILATVLSLVSVLQHLDKPDTLGPAISAAFLATFYGVAAANVIFLPIANALKKMTAIEAGERLLMIEGVLSIQSGDNPRILAEKLWSFLPPDQRETEDDAEGAGAASGAAALCAREATFTTVPIAVRSWCVRPNSPKLTLPVSTPIPTPIVAASAPKASESSSRRARQSSWIFRAAATARAAWSSCLIGKLKTARTASPIVLLTMPSPSQTASAHAS